MGKRLRILKTFPIRNGLAHWGEVNRQLIAPVACDSCDYDLWDMPDASIEEISDPYDVVLVEKLHVDMAQKAEAAGYDAIAMGCLLEPGVAAAKHAVSIPVVGALEAAVYLAALLADRFSIVKGSPQGTDWLRGLIRRMGLESRLASMRSIETLSLEFAAQESSLPGRMLALAQQAVELDGAGCVISYGGPSILSHLRGHLTVPVLNPQQCQVLLAETLCRALNRAI